MQGAATPVKSGLVEAFCFSLFEADVLRVAAATAGLFEREFTGESGRATGGTRTDAVT